MEKDFSLVIMDCNMPVMGGLEAIKKIRTLQENKYIPKFPILLCTAGSTNIKNDDLPTLDIDRCLIKPVARNILKDALEDLLQIKI